MVLPTFDPISDEALQKLTELFARALPKMPPEKRKGFARVIAESPSWGIMSHHEGKKDRDRLAKLQNGLMSAKIALAEMSPVSQSEYESAMRKEYANNPSVFERNKEIYQPDRRPLVLPLLLDEFERVISAWINAVPIAEENLKNVPANHGKSWDAIAVITDALAIWNEYAKHKVTGKKIKLERPFERFLAEIFEILNISTTPVSAYNAWYGSDRKYLDLPEQESATI